MEEIQKDLNGKTAKKRVRVRYRRAVIELTRLLNYDKVYSGECKACQKAGRTELHHWKYAYTTAEVMANILLVLDFTIELCYQCHKVADYIRNITEDKERFNQVMAALSYAAINLRKEELNV